MIFVPKWKREGTRRPFPPITQAAKLWGDRVFYKQPQYVANKHCKWCGKELSGRRTSFCSNDCSTRFNNMTVWNRGRDAYSLRILYRDNFTCQDCGEFNAYLNEHGVYIPIDNGNLNVHHIKFVCNGGGDEPENLITLCIKCHHKRHNEQKEEGVK